MPILLPGFYPSVQRFMRRFISVQSHKCRNPIKHYISSSIFKRVDITARGKRCGRAVGSRRCELADGLFAAVSGDEHARRFGAAALVGVGIAAVIQIYKLREYAVIGRVAYRDEKSVNGDLSLVAFGIGNSYAAQLVLPEQRGYAAAEHKLDVIPRSQCFDKLCFAAECISAMDKIYL